MKNDSAKCYSLERVTYELSCFFLWMFPGIQAKFLAWFWFCFFFPPLSPPEKKEALAIMLIFVVDTDSPSAISLNNHTRTRSLKYWNSPFHPSLCVDFSLGRKRVPWESYFSKMSYSSKTKTEIRKNLKKCLRDEESPAWMGIFLW